MERGSWKQYRNRFWRIKLSEMDYYVVKYSGPFGFIKPWTAVRDGGDPSKIHTYSQQFLTPSIVEGIEKKLFPELLKEDWGKIYKIKSHRLNYNGIEGQLERTWAKGGFRAKKENDVWKTNLGILNRGVMLNPHLYLVFETEDDALRAFQQTICLCRNEDLLFPEEMKSVTAEEWEAVNGFELNFSKSSKGFKVGNNRFAEGSDMFGELKIYGNPIRE